jgi:hypothetical protein
MGQPDTYLGSLLSALRLWQTGANTTPPAPISDQPREVLPHGAGPGTANDMGIPVREPMLSIVNRDTTTTEQEARRAAIRTSLDRWIKDQGLPTVFDRELPKRKR